MDPICSQAEEDRGSAHARLGVCAGGALMFGPKAFTGRSSNHVISFSRKVKGLAGAVIRSVVCLCLGCLKLLTTGPDLPVMPPGPGGPLMASCGAEKAELSILTVFQQRNLAWCYWEWVMAPLSWSYRHNNQHPQNPLE